MDGGGSGVPVLWHDRGRRGKSSVPAFWHDRGKVAKAFDVCIFFKLRNLASFQFRLGVYSALDNVLSQGAVVSSSNVSSLPSLSRTRSAVCGPVRT